ncbi:TPA: TIGR02594 family protein, partial [Acinetobacter baumannii]
GNQSNKVCYALYNDSDFQEFRWYGRTTQPASKRYNLPQLSGVTAIRVTEA